MVTSITPSSSSIFYSNHSTYATFYEKQEIRQLIDNEGYRAAIVLAGYEIPPTITQINIEPLSDYLCPDPIRSYSVKLRITSKTKGLPVNYNERCEDVL